jgi:hypothetical protein
MEVRHHQHVEYIKGDFYNPFEDTQQQVRHKDCAVENRKRTNFVLELLFTLLFWFIC